MSQQSRALMTLPENPVPSRVAHNLHRFLYAHGAHKRTQEHTYTVTHIHKT